MPRSKSNDLLRSNGTIDSLRSSNRFTNFKALKQWGKSRLKFNKSLETRIEECTESDVAGIDTQIKISKPISKPKSQLKQDPLFSPSEKIFLNLSPNEKKCPAVTNPVKMRGSMTRRQRRNQQYRCEDPNSSSGNWSASSESGRTSASSEVIMHNKSSNSCTSLNNNHKSPASSSSILTKRKINASTSSSITSDETVTHDVPSSGYVDYDDETSSMYSCDTEGYFTSFHVDSGLKTLKEEEIPVVPAMLSTSALLPINGSTSSNFGDSLSRTTLSVESDYELFGKGSTSTTASSAGTVCTTLLGSLSNKSLVECPIAPERKSSLNTKLSNYGKPKSLLAKSDAMLSKTAQNDIDKTPSTSNNSQQLDNYINKMSVVSDVEISENSDFEGAERIKRIRGKTLINSNRIPSICVITPINSDDEDRVAAMESMLSSLNINQKDLPLSDLDETKTVAQVHNLNTKLNIDEIALSAILPLAEKICNEFPIEPKTADETDGEYVTISDVNSYPCNSDKVVAKNLDEVLSGNLNLKTEYVSLNELPCNKKYNKKNVFSDSKNTKLIDGKNVRLNAQGMFVYDSNTLRYKRSLCTTFKGAPEPISTANNENVTTDRKELNLPNVASEDKRLSETSSPPFEKMASDSELDNDSDNGYVMLCAKNRYEVKGIKADFESISDPGKHLSNIQKLNKCK